MQLSYFSCFLELTRESFASQSESFHPYRSQTGTTMPSTSTSRRPFPTFLCVANNYSLSLLKLAKFVEDDLKSESNKAVRVPASLLTPQKWREFCTAYEGVMDDYNFGTLLRCTSPPPPCWNSA